MPDEYPKWVDGVVVQNAEEEAAVREGRAVFSVVRYAEGDRLSVASILPESKTV